MEIMKEFPDTTLWLMRLNDDAQSNLTQSAIDHGVDPARIVYATRVPSVAEHLARYRLADLFLDTYPYNGHTTSSDALLSGLPVITISGEIFASRVAGSLLHDYNLSELIASNVEEYKELIRIYLEPSKNAEIKAKLANEIKLLNGYYKNEERAKDFEDLLITVTKI
jgi:predicted O-linked N-acetylglucosamine transferase (SPINDLY family)